MKRIILFFAAIAAVISCRKGEELTPPSQTPKVYITAGHLRSTIADDGAVTWEGNEEIAVRFTKGAEDLHIEKFTNNVPGGRAVFEGTIKSHVKSDQGWDDEVYCIYPSTSVKDNGTIKHSLPVIQTPHGDKEGSFASDLNISYAPVSLHALEARPQGSGDKANDEPMVFFNNALTVVRVQPGSDDIKSVTLRGSAPLAGEAVMGIDKDGLLVVTEDGDEWGSKTVTLKAAEGECLTKNTIYNILVYPGKQTTFSVTINYKDYGNYTRNLKSGADLAPATHYIIGFNSDSEVAIDKVTGSIPTLPSLDELEENIDALNEQVQSVTLLSDYLDNAAYASYSALMKNDLVLDYIVKPEAAAEALVEAFKTDNTLVSAVATYKSTTNYNDLTVKSLELSEIEGVGKVVTARINANGISDNFYNGTLEALVALQVKSGATDLISDFAKLVPKVGSGLGSDYLENTPSVPGARVAIPFKYSVYDPGASFTITATGENVEDVYLNNYKDNNGNFSVVFSGEATISSPKVTLTLTVGTGENAEVHSLDFTFVESDAKIEFVDPGAVDYIGGEVKVAMENENIKSYILTCSGAKQDGDIFSFDENTGGQRTATVQCEATLLNAPLKYYKTLTLTQRASGTALTRKYYVGAGKNVKQLQTKSNQHTQNALNIVILGDGYVQKDYAEGGLFERRATSAMENFFGIEPFKSYRDRFDVFMAGYIYDKSQDQGKTPPEGGFVYEGTDNNTLGLDVHTYFDSWWDGTSTAISLAASGKTKVINAVQNDLGLTNGAYYRTIVIMLINSDANAGSTFYPEQTTGNLSGDGYHSFSVACVGANSTGFGGLIRHEAGGHAFGRLADEYITVADFVTLSAENKTNLTNAHGIGFYTNVTADNGNYAHWKMFTDAGYTSEEVGYYEGAWRGYYGCWRSSQTSIMQSTGNTGNFNAVSRYAIWRRIILQAKGIENDTMVDFVSYDQKNR